MEHVPITLKLDKLFLTRFHSSLQFVFIGQLFIGGKIADVISSQYASLICAVIFFFHTSFPVMLELADNVQLTRGIQHLNGILMDRLDFS